MPQAEGTGRFTVYMDREIIQQVSQFAKQQGYKSNAEYARALIERDMRESGQPIEIPIETWGGSNPDNPPAGQKSKRGRKKKTE